MKNKINQLENISLPLWESLPDEGIYKEELLTYLKENLKPLQVVDKNIITSSMVNNYVKLGYIDKPIKKKYYRSSIAQIILISIFKQVIKMEDLSKGMNIEISTFGLEEVYKNLYDIFKEIRDDILTSEKVRNINLSLSFKDHHDKVLGYLAISLFTKLYTKLVIDNRKET